MTFIFFLGWQTLWSPFVQFSCSNLFKLSKSKLLRHVESVFHDGHCPCMIQESAKTFVVVLTQVSHCLSVSSRSPVAVSMPLAITEYWTAPRILTVSQISVQYFYFLNSLMVLHIARTFSAGDCSFTQFFKGADYKIKTGVKEEFRSYLFPYFQASSYIATMFSTGVLG